MTNNSLKIIDCIVMSVHCEFCSNEICGHLLEEYELTERADKYGWMVIRSGKVKCPSCVAKSKRKKG